MSPLAIGTIAGAALVVVAVAKLGLTLANIGTDAHAVGPWHRPRRPESYTRLPSDLRGLWSLFGHRSLTDYPGSWEAAVRRLDRVEQSLTGHPAQPVDEPPSEPSQLWLGQRVADLEALLDVNAQSHPPPSSGAR